MAVLNELEGLGLVSRRRDHDLFATFSPTERDQLEQLLTKVADAASCSEKY